MCSTDRCTVWAGMFKCRFHIIWICWKSHLSQRQLEHSACLVTRPICRISCTKLSSVLTGVKPVDLWLWMRPNPRGQLIPDAVVGHTWCVGESQMGSLSWGALAIPSPWVQLSCHGQGWESHRTLGMRICSSIPKHSPAKGQKEYLVALGTPLGDCQSQCSLSMGDSWDWEQDPLS